MRPYIGHGLAANGGGYVSTKDEYRNSAALFLQSAAQDHPSLAGRHCQATISGRRQQHTENEKGRCHGRRYQPISGRTG